MAFGQTAISMYDTEKSAARVANLQCTTMAFGQTAISIYDTEESAARVAFGHSLAFEHEVTHMYHTEESAVQLAFGQTATRMYDGSIYIPGELPEPSPSGSEPQSECASNNTATPI